jgi:hypothetical protein
VKETCVLVPQGQPLDSRPLSPHNLLQVIKLCNSVSVFYFLLSWSGPGKIFPKTLKFLTCRFQLWSHMVESFFYQPGAPHAHSTLPTACTQIMDGTNLSSFAGWLGCARRESRRPPSLLHANSQSSCMVVACWALLCLGPMAVASVAWPKSQAWSQL